MASSLASPGRRKRGQGEGGMSWGETIVTEECGCGCESNTVGWGWLWERRGPERHGTQTRPSRICFFLIYQEFQEVIVRESRSSHFRDWFCSFLKSQIYTKSRLIISLLCVSCSMLVNPGEVLILIITSCWMTHAIFHCSVYIWPFNNHLLHHFCELY